MNMSPSTYHYSSPQTDEPDLILKKQIEAIIELLPESGYRPVTAKLRESMMINGKKVLRVMKKYQLLCNKSKAFRKPTTQSNHDLKKYPNKIADLSIDRPRQVIVGDVTAFDIRGVDHFAALLMDLFTRETLGISISDKNNTELVLACLRDASENYPDIRGAIHHSDTDVRYCSAEYIAATRSIGLTISMALGNCYENPHAESLNKTFKRQEINISDYPNKIEAARSIFAFRQLYNNERPHSALGMIAPAVFMKNFQLGTMKKGVQV